MHQPQAARKIIHIDMDAFYASVEQRDDPRLRGQPVVVAWRGARSVVCAASYEARRFGVRSAMPALRAEKLCPQAVFVAPHFNRYREVSQQVRAIFQRFTDLVEPLSLDEAYLDVSQPRPGNPQSATATASTIRQLILAETQLTASAGIAPNKFLAKIASDWNKPNGQFVIKPHQVDTFLEPLAVGKLHGVGKVTEKRMQDLGVATVGDLRAFSADRLEQVFGVWGLRLYGLARGIDHSAVRPHRPAKSVSSEDTFAEDLPLRALEPALRQLADKTWDAAKRLGPARTVTLKLKTSDFKTLTRRVSPAHPPDSAAGLADIALGLRHRVHLPDSTRYRLAGIGLSGFSDAEESLQVSLFPDEHSDESTDPLA